MIARNAGVIADWTSIAVVDGGSFNQGVVTNIQSADDCQSEFCGAADGVSDDAAGNTPNPEEPLYLGQGLRELIRCPPQSPSSL